MALMIDKYRPLIAKKISKFNFGRDYEDSFQEATLLLYKSIMKFEERFNKSFTRYFENNLENHFISKIRKLKSYRKFVVNKFPMICELHVDESSKQYYGEQEILDVIKEFSQLEKEVFRLRYIEEKTPVETAEIVGCDVKRVYNAMDRIRHKLKIHLDI